MTPKEFISRITKVDRVLLLNPFVERVRAEMERARIHRWAEIEFIRVHTDAGIVGYGETIQNYTWGRVELEARVLGRSPFELMWDDSLGAGLQMALFDAAGKLAGVPLYRLLGRQIRDWCPISFWDIDMSPEKYAIEASTAVQLGYTSIKIKARPWFDVYESVAQISAVTPDYFSIDVDWNDFLVNVSNAVPVLRELERAFPKIKIFEGPIRADDIASNKLLRSKIRTAIAHHFGSIPAHAAIAEGYCDGFVIGGGIRQIMMDGQAAAMANMPFFLQMVGTGLTTALSLHLGAVLTHAQWPAVTCHELYQHNLLTQRLEIVSGLSKVPDAPGLGVIVDESALQRYSVQVADFSLSRRLLKYHRASGIDIYFADDSHPDSMMWKYFSRVNCPVYERGVGTEIIYDDGSNEFANLYADALRAPIVRSR